MFCFIQTYHLIEGKREGTRLCRSVKGNPVSAAAPQQSLVGDPLEKRCSAVWFLSESPVHILALSSPAVDE